jgi:hypothetical protein
MKLSDWLYELHPELTFHQAFCAACPGHENARQRGLLSGRGLVLPGSDYFTVTVTQPRRDFPFISGVELVVQNLSDPRKPGFGV